MVPVKREGGFDKELADRRREFESITTAIVSSTGYHRDKGEEIG
jgi:hypothetical protein